MTDKSDMHELVIIRRAKFDPEEGRHGGVWKIAFADFMTAMMAFFLVMWLISANEKTRIAIARYFNPVQLVDSTLQPQGLNDPTVDGATDTTKTRKPLSDKENKSGAAAAKADPQSDKHTSRDDAELFKDPYAVLAELAARNSAAPTRQAVPPAEEAKGGPGAVGSRKGEAFRDPFEPLASGSGSAAGAGELQIARIAPAALAAAPPNAAPAVVRPLAKSESEPGTAEPSTTEPSESKPLGNSTATAAGEPSAEAGALRTRLATLLKQSGGAGAGDAEPKLDVRRTEEGLLITLTDDANFSMFASASAEPAPKLVVLMGKIGRMLKGEKGRITLRGFTDNRPFKSESYDNWRLSSARAHMAHYMLVRGGLDEARIDRIEGYADRRPRNPKDPGGAENRRIEILLRDDTP